MGLRAEENISHVLVGLNATAENLLQWKFLGKFGDFLEFVEGDDNRFVAKVVRQLLWQIQDLGDGGDRSRVRSRAFRVNGRRLDFARQRKSHGRASCDDAFLFHDGEEVFADPGAALRVKDVEVLEDVVGKYVRLNCELAIGDVSGNAERFRNVFDAEDCEFQLVELTFAHKCFVL